MSKARGLLGDLLGGEGAEGRGAQLSTPIVEQHGERAQAFVVVHGDLHLHFDVDGRLRPTAAPDHANNKQQGGGE
jgi:hypothetical protein